MDRKTFCSIIGLGVVGIGSGIKAKEEPEVFVFDNIGDIGDRLAYFTIDINKNGNTIIIPAYENEGKIHLEIEKMKDLSNEKKEKLKKIYVLMSKDKKYYGIIGSLNEDLEHSFDITNYLIKGQKYDVPYYIVLDNRHFNGVTRL